MSGCFPVTFPVVDCGRPGAKLMDAQPVAKAFCTRADFSDFTGVVISTLQSVLVLTHLLLAFLLYSRLDDSLTVSLAL